MSKTAYRKNPYNHIYIASEQLSSAEVWCKGIQSFQLSPEHENGNRHYIYYRLNTYTLIHQLDLFGALFKAGNELRDKRYHRSPLWINWDAVKIIANIITEKYPSRIEEDDTDHMKLVRFNDHPRTTFKNICRVFDIALRDYDIPIRPQQLTVRWRGYPLSVTNRTIIHRSRPSPIIYRIRSLPLDVSWEIGS